MEKSYACEDHGDAVLITGLNYVVVTNGTASLSHVAHTAFVSTFDVVAEGEEGIGAKADIGQFVEPLALFILGERFGTLGKELLPLAVAQHVVVLWPQIDVDGVVAVCSSDTLDEWQFQHTRMLTKPPAVGLVTSQSGAVDATLLPGTDAYGLSLLDVADGVGLRVLDAPRG